MAEQDKEMTDEVGTRAERKLRARQETHRGIWFGLGMFGVVGWSVAIPTVICVAIGVWLDRAHPGGRSWTLTLLFVGIALGCLNAWLWVSRERRAIEERTPPGEEET
jgi:ATP synthase protein I